MYTCMACKKPIVDGQQMVIVTDAVLFNGGEVEHQDTEYYHGNCVKVDW